MFFKKIFFSIFWKNFWKIIQNPSCVSGLHLKLFNWRGNRTKTFAKKLYLERIPLQKFLDSSMYKKDYFCHNVFVAIRRQIHLVCETIYSSLQMVCNTQRTACNQKSVDVIHKLIIERWKRTWVGFFICSLHYFFGNLCWLSKLPLNVVSTLLKICRIFDPFQGLLCLHVNAQHETKHFFLNGHTRS